MNQVAPKVIARVTRIAGALGVPSRSTLGEGHADIVALELSMIGFPGVVEDSMPGGNVQRKPGTARGSPRALPHSEGIAYKPLAVKSRCSCEWGGWGRLSDDGRDTTTRTRARAPGVVENPPNGGAQASPQARLRAVPLLRSRGARRTDANQTPTSACREQA